MNYTQALDYLYSRLPMFQRIGPAAYKADLSNTLRLCEALDNPEEGLRVVHIAGTNGKGSVAHMLASILQESGLKTGLFTSPHFQDFRERIRINGRKVPEKYIVDFIKNHAPAFTRITPSFFELTTVMAFLYFKDQKTDVCVVETGMGGRLDSTNVTTPDASVITNIGLDHTRFLGETLKKIAAEKAGIIKENTPVIIGETHPGTQNIFKHIAANNNAPIHFADRNFFSMGDNPMNIHTRKEEYKHHYPIKLYHPLKGGYQRKNIITCMQATEILRNLGYIIDNRNVSAGLKNIISNTGFRGRWQVLSNHPPTVCDIGHNPAGLREILSMIRHTPHKKLHMVFGTVNDKPADPVLRLLPENATYYFCKASIPRGMDAEELSRQAGKAGLTGKTFTSVKNAIRSARQAAGKHDLVFIGGSTFVVAEALELDYA
ncbi:MAG: folylpolyglutamate synthase/dihydrofolate synthase family protein [Bacteroidales bacterium]